MRLKFFAALLAGLLFSAWIFSFYNSANKVAAIDAPIIKLEHLRSSSTELTDVAISLKVPSQYEANTTPKSAVLGVAVPVSVGKEPDDNFSTTKLVLTFDQTLITVQNIRPESGFTVTKKEVNNTIGVVTVELTKQAGLPFVNGEKVAKLSFKKMSTSAKSAEIRVSRLSTLGFPNRLQSGFENMKITVALN